MSIEAYIPRYITVHLGRPDEAAENVTLTFPEYIKNVASSEIYPTWPTDAVLANIYAQISFALNRIFTEWYPSQGYDFDITNTTAFDQAFVKGRNIYANISQIVDEIFNSYVRRQGDIEPLFTAYCSGRGVNCAGLKQWDTVDLANDGLSSVDILKYYYGDDIEIVTNAPVRIDAPSYPGVPLRLGDVGFEVQTMQLRLNRIARNYPAIPRIDNPTGVFDPQTEAAVKKFQQVFNLIDDGIVGNATWYRINYIYASVKRLAELNSEGISISQLPQQYIQVLRPSDRGDYVRIVQYYLAVIARYNDYLPQIVVDGIFGPATENAVKAFQQQFGLGVDGIVGRLTWNQIYNVYRGIVRDQDLSPSSAALYPGVALAIGSRGEYVTLLQTYLNEISNYYPTIERVEADGVFGSATDRAVRAFQTQFSLTPNGVVGAITWDKIATIYDDLR